MFEPVLRWPRSDVPLVLCQRWVQLLPRCLLDGTLGTTILWTCFCQFQLGLCKLVVNSKLFFRFRLTFSANVSGRPSIISPRKAHMSRLIVRAPFVDELQPVHDLPPAHNFLRYNGAVITSSSEYVRTPSTLNCTNCLGLR